MGVGSAMTIPMMKKVIGVGEEAHARDQHDLPMFFGDPRVIHFGEVGCTLTSSSKKDRCWINAVRGSLCLLRPAGSPQLWFVLTGILQRPGAPTICASVISRRVQNDRGGRWPYKYCYMPLALGVYPCSSRIRSLAEAGTGVLPSRISCLSTSAP